MIEPLLRLPSSAPASPRTLRQFAALWLLVVGAFAVWHGVLRERPGMGLALGAIAVLIGLAGLTRPASIRWLFVGLGAVTHPIGCAVSYLLLSVFFYLVLWPLGVCFRIVGRDPLALRERRVVTSYLTKKPAAGDVACYFRQS